MKLEPRQLWEECLKIFKDNISAEQFRVSFAYVEFRAYENGNLVLGVPSYFIKDFLEEHYSDLMQSTFKRIFGTKVNLYYKVHVINEPSVEHQEEGSKTNQPHINNGIQVRPANQSPDTLMAPSVVDLDSQLRPSYNFDNFIEGESNILARTVGQSIAENPAKTFNPFFVYGPSGCGKTHLVNAIGLRVKELHPQMRVLYLSAHLFTVQYMDAVKQNKIAEFIAFYQTIDTLIIDDVHELAGKTGTQQAFFHIFNHLHLNGKQIILTCDRPPIAIAGLEDRLLTRFKWGLQAEIEKPTRALRLSILNDKVRKAGLNIPENVLNCISDQINESIRDLEGVINSLLAYSVVHNCDINMKLLQKIMPTFVEVKEKRLTTDAVKKKVCEFFNVKIDDIDSRTRRQPISYIRQLIIYISSKYTEESQVQIGLNVGGRNHATVLHSINQIKNLIDTDDKTRSDVNAIENLLV